jgi:signal transduction histidine kinase
METVKALTRADLEANDVALDIQIEAGLPIVAADAVGIEQAMINLVRNATDALGTTDRTRRRIILCAFKRDRERVGVCVSDNGPGIAESDFERIFKPLFTTKLNGIGMGLAIVRSIIESHGSRITVESVCGNGARFEFDLPIAG